MGRGSTQGCAGHAGNLIRWAGCLGLLVALLSPAAVVLAQEGRPAEADIFSDVPEEPEVTAPPRLPTEPPPPDFEAEEPAKLRERTPPPALTEERLRQYLQDYTQIGGLFYFRTLTEFREDTAFNDSDFSAPLLSDFYVDARASDRLRGFWSGRLELDPTQEDDPDTEKEEGFDVDFILNELWIRTDIAQRLFITMGQQHVKWGTGTVWNPTDFLQPQKLDPLDPFDFRVGVDMVKFHYPLEAEGMNFYAYLLFEDADTLKDLGGALRYDVVIGTGEYGLDFVVPPGGGRVQGGGDWSAGVGPFDIYGEVALLNAANIETPACTSLGSATQSCTEVGDIANPPREIAITHDEGFEVQTVAGIQWATLLREEDKFDLGLEYFYNGVGTDDTETYDELIDSQLFQPFYIGEHYLALYAGLEGPFDWNDMNLMVFNIANLSDTSFVTQVNMAYAIYVNLTFEVLTSVYYGSRDGEFRTSKVAGNDEARPIFDLGIRFKLKI